MKKVFAVVTMLLWASQVSAATMSLSADNAFSSITINGQNVVSDLHLITEAELNDNGLDTTGTGWRTLETIAFTLSPATTYTILWTIGNYQGTATSSNPLAFIGTVDLGNGVVFNSETSDSSWAFSGTGTLYESAYGSSPWSSPFGSSSAVNAANWISYRAGDSMTAQLTFTTTPVPVPAALWLLGTGLVGLVGVRRKIS